MTTVTDNPLIWSWKTDGGGFELPWSDYIPHRPTPKQLAFLLLGCREAFFGGSGGGGKSDALLMAALQYVETPGYHAILFRRTYQDLALEGALMDRSKDWLASTDAHWSEMHKRWTFPSGATLSFGYLDSALHKYRYQGAAWSFVGWDELTQFNEQDYRYLFSRLRRTTDINVPLRMRSASNPGGVGHEWVKRRMIDEGQQNGRVFIPARLVDNPYLDREEYTASLMELDPITRAQLLNGDWEVRSAGGLLRREWFRVVDELPQGRQIRWVRFWDLAATEPKTGVEPDWTVGCLVGRDDSGTYYIGHIDRFQMNPGDMDIRMKNQARIDGLYVSQRMEQEPGASGKITIDHFRRTVFDGYNFDGIPSTKNKVDRARPVSSTAHAGNILIVNGPWVGDFFDEIDAFPEDGVHDDQVDALSGAFGVLSGVGTGVPLHVG